MVSNNSMYACMDEASLPAQTLNICLILIDKRFYGFWRPFNKLRDLEQRERGKSLLRQFRDISTRC
jgi:hypothetical protein